MTFEQETKHGVLKKLKVRGSDHELRSFALELLDAIDNGRSAFDVVAPDDTKLKVRIRLQ